MSLELCWIVTIELATKPKVE